MKPRVEHIYHVLLFSFTAIFVFSFVYLIYLSSDGSLYNKPIVFNSETLQTTRTTYRPGEMVYAIVDFCKYRDIPAAIQWELIDTIIRFYPEETRSSPVGCFKKEMEIAKIPADVSPAPYYFVGLVRYKINRLSEVSYRLKSNTFEVVR